MRLETSMRPEHLPLEHISHSQILLGHVSDMLTLTIHNHVLIRLLEP